MRKPTQFLWLPLLLTAATVYGQQPPAQEPKPAETAAAPAETKPADAKPAEAAPAAAASPVPTGETWLTGFFEVGYRWRTDVGGSFETYRSIVNLGSGPKLLGTEFTIRDKKRRLFDRMEVRAYDWGGDPYSTAHVNLFRENTYQLITDYRNFAYYDNLPSFADPLLATRGIMLNEQSFDLRRKIGNALFEVRPGTWLVPYLAWDHDSSDGHGVQTFAANTNEYPFLSQMNDRTESYRGGIRLELPRFHVTLEQGGTTFRQDQNMYGQGGPFLGSATGPVLGRTLNLTSLVQAYGIRGSSIYSRGLVSAHVTNWLDVTGQFLYSQPKNDVNYFQTNTGTFASVNQALFWTTEQNLLSAAAKMPHTTGGAGLEMRPLKRVRIVESWMTDRLHNAAAAIQKDLLGTTPVNTNLTSTLLTNYSQVEGNVFVDVFKNLIVRGGYRYQWGMDDEHVLPFEGLTTFDKRRLQRNVVLGGVTFRPSTKYSLSGDVEAGMSNSVNFPISLYDYQKFRIRGSDQISNSLTFSAQVSWLKNQSPSPQHYDYLSHAESGTLQYNPKAGKRFSVLGTWEHSVVRSNILYLLPQSLAYTNSNYWESGHTITGLVNVTLPKLFGAEPVFSGGGSYMLLAGTRASNYYQPVGKLAVPVGKHLAWNTEWKYYGFGESFYLYESFRTHIITTGLRFTR
jgi:hypothetical protein